MFLNYEYETHTVHNSLGRLLKYRIMYP